MIEKPKKTFITKLSKSIKEDVGKEISQQQYKTNCINFNKILEQNKSDPKWVEDSKKLRYLDTVDDFEEEETLELQAALFFLQLTSVLELQAAPCCLQSTPAINEDYNLDVSAVRSHLFTNTFVPIAIGIIEYLPSPVDNQIQNSSILSGDIYWFYVVKLSSTTVSNEFLFGSKSNREICREEDDFNCILTEIFDIPIIHQALPRSQNEILKKAFSKVEQNDNEVIDDELIFTLQ